MRIQRLCLLLLLSCFTVSDAQTKIGGTIGGKTFNASGNPWIVSSSIVVPANQKTTIKQGCIFLFKPFTGLEVNGNLEVDGKTSTPVVFTAISDTIFNKTAERNPESFDWNGIAIGPSAKADFNDFILSYSVYGIKSNSTDIHLTQGIFRSNSQFNFTINDQILPVTVDSPFTMSSKYISTGFPRPEPPCGNCRLIASGFLLTGCAVLALSTYQLSRIHRFETVYAEGNSQDIFDTTVKKRSDAVLYASVCGLISGICIPTSVLLLVRDHKRKAVNRMDIFPVLGTNTGFVMNFNF